MDTEFITIEAVAPACVVAPQSPTVSSKGAAKIHQKTLFLVEPVSYIYTAMNVIHQ